MNELSAFLKQIWPILQFVFTAILIPVGIWVGKRFDRRESRIDKQEESRAKHEERRTSAFEAIPVALNSLQHAITQSLTQQSVDLKAAMAATETRILQAIESKRLDSLEDLIKERISDPPSQLTNPSGARIRSVKDPRRE